MSISVRGDEHHVVVRVAGEIDMATAPTLAARIHGEQPAPQGQLVIDLSRVEFCDASGLRVIVDANRRVSEIRGHLILRSVPANVQKLLTATELANTFTLA